MKLNVLAALAALSMITPLWAAVGDAEAGQAKAAVCVACHGIDGNSVDPQYPKIAGQHAEYAADQLARFKSGQRQNAIMMAFAVGLSEQDMLDLAAFFETQTVKPGTAQEDLVGPAQALYRGGDPKRGIPACMACHGPGGAGNPGSRYPALAGQHTQYSVDMLKRFRAGEIHGAEDDAHAKIMSQISEGLSDDEIIALASYLEGLHSATP